MFRYYNLPLKLLEHILNDDVQVVKSHIMKHMDFE